MKFYASRYCGFAVPDDWASCPPFAFVGPINEEERLSAQVLATFPAEILQAKEYACKQQQLLPALYEGFRLLNEAPHHTDSLGQGYRITFRYIDEVSRPALASIVYLTIGPLVCQLTLSGNFLSESRVRDLFETIGNTFRLHEVDFLAGADLDSALISTDSPASMQGSWKKFSMIGVSLPTIEGWEANGSDGGIIYRKGDAEIHLRRYLEGDGDLDRWMAETLNGLQERGDRLLALQRGALGHRPFLAVLFKNEGVKARWRTAASRNSLLVLLNDDFPLRLSVYSSEPLMRQSSAVASIILSSLKVIDASEWETQPTEPWVEVTLKGAWQAQGSGVYAKVESGQRPLLLQLADDACNIPIDKLKSSFVESIRKDFYAIDAARETQSLGLLQQCEALHYSVDGYSEAFGQVSVRALWVRSGLRLLGILARGQEPEETEALFRRVVESLRLSTRY